MDRQSNFVFSDPSSSLRAPQHPLPQNSVAPTAGLAPSKPSEPASSHSMHAVKHDRLAQYTPQPYDVHPARPMYNSQHPLHSAKNPDYSDSHPTQSPQFAPAASKNLAHGLVDSRNSYTGQISLPQPAQQHNGEQSPTGSRKRRHSAGQSPNQDPSQRFQTFQRSPQDVQAQQQQQSPQMQLAALNTMHGATSNQTMASAPLAQNAFSNPIQFAGSQPLPQLGLGTAGPGGFPQHAAQLQPPQTQNQQQQLGNSAAQLSSNYASTGALSNSILPAAVVDDPSATGAAAHFANSLQGGEMQGAYPWADPQVQRIQHQSQAQQQHQARQRNSQQMHFSQQMQPQGQHQFRPQQQGRNESPQMNSSALGGMTGTFSSGLANGLGHVGSAIPGVPMGIQQTFPEADPVHVAPSNTARSYPPGTAVDGLAAATYRGKQARPMHELAHGYSGHMTHTVGGGPGDMGPNLQDGAFPTGIRQEDSSAMYGRQIKRPGSKSRNRRRSANPNAPVLPVHLRNPKKGRARVYRKCQLCQEENHIRRSNCANCKEALPAGKRRLDGGLTFTTARNQSNSNPISQQQAIGVNDGTASSQTTPVTSGAGNLRVPPMPRQPEQMGNG